MISMRMIYICHGELMSENISIVCNMCVTVRGHWSGMHVQTLRVRGTVCQRCTKYDNDAIAHVTTHGSVN